MRGLKKQRHNAAVKTSSKETKDALLSFPFISARNKQRKPPRAAPVSDSRSRDLHQRAERAAGPVCAVDPRDLGHVDVSRHEDRGPRAAREDGVVQALLREGELLPVLGDVAVGDPVAGVDLEAVHYDVDAGVGLRELGLEPGPLPGAEEVESEAGGVSHVEAWRPGLKTTGVEGKMRKGEEKGD